MIKLNFLRELRENKLRGPQHAIMQINLEGNPREAGFESR